MLFGDTNRFGIEFEISPNPVGTWMYGPICYWLCGLQVGDYEQITSLRDALYWLEHILWDAGTRVNQNLMRLDTEDLVNMLSHSMFGNHPVNEVLESRAIEEQWARHIIDPEIEIFSGWHIYLVEEGNVGRCVYHNSETDRYYECRLKYGEFDQVLREAVQSLQQHYEALVK